MQSGSNETFLTDMTRVVLLCVSYAIAGKLALMLALPPGYATAIFPSAGIAITALLLWGNRLWPGIFFGSLLLNIWVGSDQGPLTMSGWAFAVSAGVGATLQALVGAWLVKRFVGFPTALSKEWDIIKFMLVAGPLPCLLNATFGVGALYATGVISQSEIEFSWFTWWAGDTIGVLIAAPLMLIAFAHPRKLWWGRRTVVAIPSLLALSAVIGLFYMASKVEQEKIESNFTSIANDTHEKMRASFKSYLDSVAYIERFFSSSQQISREDFRTFVDFTLANKPGIQGLSWNPLILNNQRDQFEKSVRQEGFADFQITERDSSKALIRAGERDEYVAVQFIEPMQGNEGAFGFDVASNPARQSTLIQARDSGKAMATPRITLVQESVEQAGFLIFQPVYRGSSDTTEQRKNALKGFAVGVFRVGDIIDVTLKSQYKDDIIVSIDDVDNGKFVHMYGPQDVTGRILLEDSLDIGGRKWVVRYWPTPSYLAAHRGWQSWGVLAIGLLFTSLMGAFLLAMTGRSYSVENLVQRRTAELRGILSTAIETIITLDASGKVESVNPAGEALFGYSSNELTGKSILGVIPDLFSASGDNTGTAKTLSLASERRDTYAVKKDGSKIPIEMAVSAVSLVDRTIFTAIIHDLTERKKVNRMKDEFVSTVSHELRTPLTSISGSLGLILGGVLDNEPDKIQHMMKIAAENCERLTRLVNNLLTFNKITLSENSLNLRIMPVNALIDHALVVNQGYAAKYGVSFNWTPVDNDINVNVDEDKMIQVLSNILSNAVKYSPTAGAVVVSVRPSATEVRISIADSGPGIPVEFQQKVFERFSQADSSDTRRVGGTGLGTSIAKLLVEQHGGRISFVSQPGQGTTFHIDLRIVNSQGETGDQFAMPSKAA
ncbi:MAG: CHASE domain-containing protein [Gammaproteobacteria bacterium]|nr:CHASE domain-containing protein [Gammaproteobacteria bacterium]